MKFTIFPFSNFANTKVSAAALPTLLACFLFGGQLMAQVFNVPSSGSDTSSSCFGLLRDPGGAGNYGAYEDGYFVIDPPGNGAVSLIFSSFNTQSFSDYVRIYDGAGINGTLIGSYYGNTLPAGGSSISSTSGAITVRFQSNCCTHYSGFELSWTTAASTLPTANFAVNTSPAYNSPVQFINTTINGGTYLWEFGDGSTSTATNPIHNYTIAGAVQARVIATNCAGSDTSAYKTINVQAAPNGTVSTDTVTMTVACGSSNSTSFTISNSGSGSMSYGLNLSQLNANNVFSEDFEANNLGAFTNLNSSYTTTTIQNSGAPQGSRYLSMVGSGYIDDALRATIPASTPEYFSYRIKDDSYASYHGYVNLIERAVGYKNMFFSTFRYNELRLYHRDANGLYTYYLHPRTQGTWYHIELKNIDWSSKSYDIYVDGVAVVTGAQFIDNTISAVNEVDVFHSSYGDVGIDDFQMSANDLLSKITYNPKSGNLTNGSSNVIFLNANAAGLNAGTYWLNFTVTSNDTALDGMVIPLKLIVTGTAVLSQSVNCVNLGTTFTGFPSRDSVLLSNSGCDTLDFSSITTSNGDITTSQGSLKIGPGDTTKLYITLNSSTPGSYVDTVFLNGPDTNSVVCVTATSTGAPQITMDTTAINVTVNGCDDSVLVHKTIYNTGLGALTYSTSGYGDIDLQDVLDIFKANYTSVTAFNPQQYNFSEGFTGYGIGDGGGDMYDGGNYLSTNLNSSYLNYSQDLIIPNVASLGTGGQYFTYKATGILLFAADINGVNTFNINGNLGADGSGFSDATILTTSVNGRSFKGFVKRVYSAGDPSVNHLVIVEDQGTPSHTYATNTNDDNHEITGLNGQTRIYHLLYAGSSGYYINNAATLNIMNAFLSMIAGNGLADFVTVSPDSGQVAAGDSIDLDLWVKSTGLSSGVYSTQVGITTNDPADTNAFFKINLTVVGSPEIEVPASCVAFDSVMIGRSVSDTIAVYNTGCDTLDITGYTSTNLDFTANILTASVAPGDTGMVELIFNPASIVAYNDTIFLANNDTLAAICVNGAGLGAPLASINPDSLYASFTSCNDSLTIPIKLYNSGLGDLFFELKGQASSTIKVVLYQYSSYSNEYFKVRSIINQMPNIQLVESNAYTSIAMTNELADADVLVIPEGSSLPTAVIAPIQNFCNTGGTYIHLLNSSYNLSQVGIFSLTNTSGISTSSTINSLDQSHPIMAGLGATIPAFSATYEMILTGSNYNILAQRNFAPSNSGVVVTTNYGAGKGVYIGYDYFAYNNVTEQILKQAIKWGAQTQLPSFVKVAPDSGMVAINDSMTINVTISSKGMVNGRDTTTLVVYTNDPLNPEIRIPLVVDVNGSSHMEVVSAACLNFDSLLVGATASDSIWIKNTGCDSLTVSGSSSSSGDFSLTSTPMTLAVGDSMVAWVNYTPSAIGTVNDTLFIFGDSDTIGVCVSGKGLGAPVGVLNPDTLRVTLNSCNSFVLNSFTMQNNGQGAMGYDVRLSETYQDTSLTFYNVNGASTTHTFANTPSTADTIWFTVVVNGDFDGTGEDYSVIVEGVTITSGYNTQNLTIGNNDSATFFYTGPNIATWLADNSLSVTVANTSSVGANFTNALDFHFVEIKMGTTPSWVSLLSPATGSLGIGSTATKNLIFNGGSLPPGVYTTTINVLSNDPVNPVLPLPVIFTLVNEPEIAVSDTCLNFPTTLIGDTASVDFWIYNRGCQQLSIGSIVPANNNFKVTPSTSSVAAGDSAMITVRFIPTSVNSFNSNLIINNNDSTIVICLNGTSNALPVADFNYSVENACTGEVLFTDNSQYSPNGYYWDFGDGSTGTVGTITHFFTKPGTYKVFFRAINSAGFDTISKTITINPFVGEFGMSDDTVLVNTMVNFYDSTITASNWSWDFGDGNTDTVQNPTHTYTAVGTYTVTLNAEDNRNCKLNITKTIRVYDDVSVNEYSIEGVAYSLFPNPSEGLVNLESTGLDWRNYQLQVVDATGRVVRLINPETEDKVVLDLGDLRGGMYQLMILRDGALKSRKSLIIK